MVISDLDFGSNPVPELAQQPRQCDGAALREALSAGMAWLERHIDLVNSLNVFPVPDGDTGTNMFLTMQAALKETASLVDLKVSRVVQAISHGALMGARGNSGVILSQLLRGMAKVLDHEAFITASNLADALMEGVATAYKGVIKPVEGTILTVAREAAAAAKRAAGETDDISDVLQATVNEARSSVAKTPSLLPELREAGVVDAGGQGLLLILEGALRLLRGEQVETGVVEATLAAPTVETGAEYGYDTQLVISAPQLSVEQVRATIASMGDSVMVVGDETAIKVHVHTGRPGAVIDYAISVGAISDVVVENMQQQSLAFGAAREQRVSAMEHIADIAVVAVAAGAGFHDVFRSLGASAVVSGGQSMNPSTEELLKALQGLVAHTVILLPNNSNVILAARQAQQLTDKDVRVIPTKTIPQGISALLAFNYQAGPDANITAMEEAAARIQTGEITTAVRSAQVNGLKVYNGQFIGLLNGDLCAAGETIAEVADTLLRDMHAEEYDIITIYYGAETSPQDAEALAEHVRQTYTAQEVEVVSGGQPHYNYIISAE